jgi:alcohol dehydrogenase
MRELIFESRTRVVFGAGCLRELGRQARDLGFRRCLLVADQGMEAAGYTARARQLLEAEGIVCFGFQAFDANPDSHMVETGRALAASHGVDSIVGLGGGSSMDCAKGINFVLTNGGVMADYWGYGKAARPMLPMIGIPTTAGTGSEAQSYTLISDPQTHRKMACGDPKAAFRVALLDPELCLTAPQTVRATSGYDAISHAVETWVTKNRNAFSQAFCRQAWRLLEGAFPRVMSQPGNVEAMADMLLGSHLAGMAIEHSMLGATHACANPLTARYGTVHGVAIGLLLRHVVEWNQTSVNGAYKELHSDLPRRLEELAHLASLPRRLRDAGVERADIPALAEDAATQWTGRFNPRPFDAQGAKEVYECAW